MDPQKRFFPTIQRFISQLFLSIWLFFPGILFIVLTIWLFWSLDQGKDLIIAFSENPKARLYFFIAVAFWTYVSWYSSRVITYLKEDQVGAKVPMLERFPRLLGLSCWLAIELAVWQSPLFAHPLPASKALLLFLLGLVILITVDNALEKWSNRHAKGMRIIFYILLGLFIVFIILIPLDRHLMQNNITGLFWSGFYLQGLFLLYSNLRRKNLEQKQAAANARAMMGPAGPASTDNPAPAPGPIERFMQYFRIPVAEKGYFILFNLFCILGLIIYTLEIFRMDFAVHIGPFPSVILAFAILLGFGNLLTTLSVKAGINLHFIVFLLALVIPATENHRLRTLELAASVPKGVFHQKQTIEEYYDHWIEQHPELDSSDKKDYPVYFVLSNGGASRSAYWTASVLGRLEDSSIAGGDLFSHHVFCLSGTSGGGVGVASFFSMLKNAHGMKREPQFERSAKNFLEQDFLSFTMTNMLGPDYFKYIFHTPSTQDRSGALESSFEKAPDTSYYPLRFGTTMDSCIALRGTPTDLPVLCINTTRMQDGNPAVVSTIAINSKTFNGRVDVLNLLDSPQTIRLSSASIMGARFPYISPAVRLDEKIARVNGRLLDSCCRPHYFVDGGYFDNSGAGVVQEMITAIVQHIAASTNPVIRARSRKLQFVILHITNSPIGDTRVQATTPLTNDLLSPGLTILGAYNMQTTINDKRLTGYLSELNRINDSANIHSTRYLPIHLYRDWYDPRDSMPLQSYSMNWFISDTVRRRMDIRLNKQPSLKDLLHTMK